MREGRRVMGRGEGADRGRGARPKGRRSGSFAWGRMALLNVLLLPASAVAVGLSGVPAALRMDRPVVTVLALAGLLVAELFLETSLAHREDVAYEAGQRAEYRDLWFAALRDRDAAVLQAKLWHAVALRLGVRRPRSSDRRRARRSMRAERGGSPS